MAFTNSPETSTYTTKEVKLVRELNPRPDIYTTKDEDYLNSYIDVVKDKLIDDKRVFITKRSGTNTFINSVHASNVRGLYYWADRRKVAYAVDNDVYIYNLNTNTNSTLSAVFSTTSGDVGFCEYLYDTGTSVLVATDGTTLVTIDNSNTVTASTSPDLPTPHVPVPVFIDGYILLAKENTGDIYNSNLNDPLLWTAGDSIMAEIEGDWVVRIAKMNNYLIAFGKNTIEYYWDAGIETGSPFQRNDSVVKHIGYYGGFAQQGKNILFVGTDTHGQLDVFLMEDLKVTEVGTPYISRYLNNQGDLFASIRGSIIAISGKNFYIMTTGDYTFVLDLETKLWSRWAYQGTNTFPVIHAVNVKKTSVYFPVLAMDNNTSELLYMNDQFTQDKTTSFTFQGVTEPSDFGGMNRKSMHRLAVVGDRPPTDASLLIQWSDDDYQTFNAGVSVNLNQDLPSITRLGSFRQRSFKFSYTGDQPIRLQRFEVDLNRGIS